MNYVASETGTRALPERSRRAFATLSNERHKHNVPFLHHTAPIVVQTFTS